MSNMALCARCDSSLGSIAPLPPEGEVVVLGISVASLVTAVAIAIFWRGGGQLLGPILCVSLSLGCLGVLFPYFGALLECIIAIAEIFSGTLHLTDQVGRQYTVHRF